MAWTLRADYAVTMGLCAKYSTGKRLRTSGQRATFLALMLAAIVAPHLKAQGPTLTATSLNFGSWPVGQGDVGQPLVVGMINNSRSGLFLAITIVGANAGDFGFAQGSDGYCSGIQAGYSCNLYVYFTAQGPGTRTASVNINYTYGTPCYVSICSGTESIGLTGVGQQYIQTISFGPLSNVTYPAPPFYLTATATSGLPVTFASGTPAVCTVSGATITIVGTGTCSIVASQAGNAYFSAAPSVTQSFAVSPSSGTQTITFGAIGSVPLGSEPITVTATASSGLPVTFTSNTPSVCTVSGATVTLVTAGTCSITASQAGNASYATATPVAQSFTILPQSAKAVYTYAGADFINAFGFITTSDHITISLTYSAPLPANYTCGLDIGFCAGGPNSPLACSISDGYSSGSCEPWGLTTDPTGKIAYWVILGSTAAGGVTDATMNPGTPFYEETYYKNISGNTIAQGDSNTPGTWTMTIVTQPSATTTSLTSSANPSLFGQSVTLTATVTPSTATGTITFTDGATSLGVVTLANGTASLTSSTLAVGTHSLTAVYSGDTNNASSTSPVITQVVNQATSLISTFTTLNASPNPSVRGQQITLTAAIEPVLKMETGTVTFYDGTAQLGTATVGGGFGVSTPEATATFATANLTTGVHSLSAQYSGDSNYAPSVSNVVMQVVNPAVLTITTSTLPGGTVGSLYSQTLTASGGTPPYSNWVLNLGMLPPGLTLNASTGTISGNPTTSVGSPFSFTVIVKDSTGTSSAPQSLSISISQPSGLTIITASPLPPGTVGVPYAQAFDATGGATPYRNWTVTAGTIPPGTSLTTINSFLAGLLTGTPTAGGTYTFSVQVTDSVAATATKQFSLTINSPGTISTSPNGIVNAASYAGGGVAPGEIVAIFGSGIGPNTLASLQVNPNGTLATTLSGVQVLFDGNPAPLIYVSSTQVSAVVPYEVSGVTSTQIQVIYQGQKSSVVTVPLTTAEPGIFSLDGSGSGAGAILNQDGSVNSSTNPASSGSIIVLYATGEGQTNPAGVDGELDGSPAPKPLQPVTATVGGLPATIIYAGGVSGLVAGVLQVNIQLPQGVTPANAVPVTLNIGGASSQTGVTAAIK